MNLLCASINYVHRIISFVQFYVYKRLVYIGITRQTSCVIYFKYNERSVGLSYVQVCSPLS